MRLELSDEVRRSRLTVFFRFLLAVPHLIWLTLWSVLVLVLVTPAWLIALVIGRLPSALHRFFAAWIRYTTHVLAFLYVIGGPFPGFTGAAGSYPVDVAFDPPRAAASGRHARSGSSSRSPPSFSRARTARLRLVVALLGWWAALFTGRMPEGLRNLGAVSLRYSAQVDGVPVPRHRSLRRTPRRRSGIGHATCSSSFRSTLPA